MDAQIRRLEERVARQDERIGELERRLKRNARNSSAPPSSDPPKGTPKRGKDSSGRKRGGQPGREGSGRELLRAPWMRSSSTGPRVVAAATSSPVMSAARLVSPRATR